MKYTNRGYQERTFAACLMCGAAKHGRIVWEPTEKPRSFLTFGQRPGPFPKGTVHTCRGDCTDAFITEQTLTRRRTLGLSEMSLNITFNRSVLKAVEGVDLVRVFRDNLRPPQGLLIDTGRMRGSVKKA